VLPASPPALKVTPLRFRLETLGPFHVPEYKGALFRGGFGQYFRDLICVTRAPVCTGCPHLTSCPYSLVFETPVIAGQFTVLRKYPNAPHPFVLTPPLDGRTAIGAGAKLDLGVTLIGRGIDYLPHFIRVVEEMGRDGRYGGRFRLQSVVAATEPETTVYDGGIRQYLNEVPAWKPAEADGAVRRIALEFLTPLRIRTEGRYNLRPDFVAVTHSLLRRVHLLCAIYGDGTASDDLSWTRALLRQADTVKTERADFRTYQWDRRSGRQGRRVQMDGVLGTLVAQGELTELTLYFRLGEWLHVGNGTSMGLGKYLARFEP